jgi:hypothetical protein
MKRDFKIAIVNEWVEVYSTIYKSFCSTWKNLKGFITNIEISEHYSEGLYYFITHSFSLDFMNEEILQIINDEECVMNIAQLISSELWK